MYCSYVLIDMMSKSQHFLGRASVTVKNGVVVVNSTLLLDLAHNVARQMYLSLPYTNFQLTDFSRCDRIVNLKEK